MPPSPPAVLPPLPWKTKAGFRSIGHQQVSIRTLVTDVLKGSYCLPDFQRSFVWEDARVVRLLDSLRRGFHVGSIITWRTACPVKTVSFGGVEVTTSGSAYGTRAILDGQQRVSSLVRATCSGQFFVHLLTGDFLVNPEPAAWVAPLATVLVPMGRPWYDGHQKLHAWAPAHAAQWGLDRNVLEDVVCEMHGAFDGVYLSVVELDPEHTRTDLVEMFVRLATEGVPVSPEDLDRALARMAGPEGGT